jgi:hypothetical protein
MAMTTGSSRWSISNWRSTEPEEEDSWLENVVVAADRGGG